MRRWHRAGALVASAAIVAGSVACSSSARGGGSPSALHVVAAESFWGSIASQIGGRHAAGCAQQRSELRRAMQPYHRLIAEIRSSYAGTKVGATETIFEYMARALGLDLVSPEAFMRAVAEGNDPPAASVAEFQQQLGN